MKVYRCFAKLKHFEKEGVTKTVAVWYTRKGDRIRSEKSIKDNPKNERYDVTKITHKEFDISTKKVGLLEFLNKYCRR